MIKAQLAGLVLLMGTSMAAQAHHHHTFAGDPPAASRTAGTFAHDPPADDMSDGCHTASPVPEPGTYAMLLAGLGMMTGIVRRKRLGR